MRMLIAPNAAIDGPTYEQYQSCLAQVPLNQGLKAVAAAREVCVSFVSATLPKLTTSLIATELVTRQEAGATKRSGSDLQTFLNVLVLNSQ